MRQPVGNKRSLVLCAAAKTGISLMQGVGKTSLAYVARIAPIASTAIGATLPVKEAIAIGGNFGTLAKVDASSNRDVVVALGVLGLNGDPVRALRCMLCAPATACSPSC